MNLTVREIAALCGGRLEGDGSAPVTAFYTDSRQTQPGMMFVPIRGENTDAHRFIPQVFAAGAAATFSETPLENPAGPVVYVENTRAALQAVAERYRERFSIPVIGITGSVGKTTTKEMVALAVSAGLRTMKTAGNANSQIGLPLTVLRMESEDEAAIVEMGVSMPGEMVRIAKVAKPTLAVMTNIGVSHIEFMKTRENIMAEKLRIADYLPTGGTVFVNGDDDLLSTLKSTPKRSIVRFGLCESCDWRAVELNADVYGTRFTCLHGGRETRVYVPAAGEHNVRNALAALAVADAVGVPLEKAARAVAQYEPPAMRQQIREARGVTLIDDTYNASPDSMKSALKVLEQSSCSGKKTAILGDMYELGTQSGRQHHGVGVFARGLKIDNVIAVGENAKDIAEGAGGGDINVMHFDEKEELYARLKELVHSGDIILVKGSRGMKMEQIVDKLLEI